MLKKRYIVIALGIISVLLGSLLYTSLVLAGDITPSGKPQPTTFKDCMEISLLNFPSATSFSVYLRQFGENVTMPFAFNPQENLLNVTDAWVSIIVRIGSASGYDVRFDFTVNGVTAKTYAWYAGNSPSLVSMPLTRPLCETITEGINTMSISGGEKWIWETSSWDPVELLLYQVTIFIEYEYQA